MKNKKRKRRGPRARRRGVRGKEARRWRIKPRERRQKSVKGGKEGDRLGSAPQIDHSNLFLPRTTHDDRWKFSASARRQPRVVRRTGVAS